MLEKRELCWVNIKKCRHGIHMRTVRVRQADQEARVEQRQVGPQLRKLWRLGMGVGAW